MFDEIHAPEMMKKGVRSKGSRNEHKLTRWDEHVYIACDVLHPLSLYPPIVTLSRRLPV